MSNTKNIIGKLTFTELYGRLPTPKKGGAMKSKKGKGSYQRTAKHKKGWSLNDHPFFYDFFLGINNSIIYKIHY